jgi:Bacterial Ig-like domain (group 2)
MRQSIVWLVFSGLSATLGNAEAQGALKQLKLEAPPTQTLFCAVGEQVQLSLTGMDDRSVRTPLDQYKVRIRTSNPAVVSAQGRSPGWATIDAVCKADGDAWILADANDARAWMRVLVGSARLASTGTNPPPDALWNQDLAVATVQVNPTIAMRTRVNATRAQSIPVATVTLSAIPAVLEQGSTQQIDVTLQDASGASVSGPVVSWQSSSPAVAAVDANGLVTGIEPGGPVTITATSGTASATATLTVSAIRPLAGVSYTYGTAQIVGSLQSGSTVEVRSYFASTGDRDRWYAVRGTWPQPSGCAAGVPIGPTLSVKLTGVPTGRQYELWLMKDYQTVVEASRLPGNQDQSVSVGGACGTPSATYYVWVHRASGLPTSTPFILRFTEGT